MALGAAHPDAEVVRDLAIGEAMAEQGEHLPLAPGK